MEHIRKLLPYGVGILVLWIGLEYTANIYEAYEGVCAKDIYLGCKGIYHEITALRFMTMLCAATSGYAFSKYLAWAKADQERHQKAKP